MKKLISLLVVLSPLALATSTGGIVVNLGDGSVRTVSSSVVGNGSFEIPVLASRSACATFFNFPTCSAIPSWSGNFYLVNGDSGGAISGVPDPPIPDGNQYIMIQTTGSATQSITINQPGLYTLSWFDAGRTFFSNIESYSVSFDGNLLGFFTTTTTSPWSPHSLQINAGAGTFALTFQGTNLQGGDNSTFFDNIVLGTEDAPPTSGVPEPSSLALGAGALAFLTLRGLRLYSGRWKAQEPPQA